MSIYKSKSAFIGASLTASKFNKGVEGMLRINRGIVSIAVSPIRSLAKIALLLVVLGLAAACAEEAAPNTIQAVINGGSIEFSESDTALTVNDGIYQLDAVGNADSDRPFSLTVEFHADALAAGDYQVDGKTTLRNGEITFEPNTGHDPAITAVWAGQSCSDCGVTVQEFSGVLSVEDHESKFVATFDVTLTGDVAAWGAVEADIQVDFSLGIPSSPVVPVEPVIHTVTLDRDQGVDFATGEVLKPGNFKADMYATRSSTTLKLSPGADKSTNYNPVEWFLTDAGTYEEFGSLSQVPELLPADDSGTALVKARTGNGFVVKNNRSSGYTRGWVELAEDGTVVIQYARFDK
jgi:hypothetical protein